MNDTQIILKEISEQDAYNLYNVVKYANFNAYDFDIIFEEYYYETDEVDKEKLILTLAEEEYNTSSNVITIMLQIINNQKIKQQLFDTNQTDLDTIYHNLYHTIVYERNIDEICYYLLELAEYNYSSAAVNSDIVRELINNNIDFSSLVDDDIKYYNALAYKLESYDIFLDYYNFDDEYKDFAQTYAQIFDIDEYYDYEKLTGAVLYNYIDLQYYLDEVYNIPDRLSYYINYDKLIYAEEIAQNIQTPVTRDYYTNEDLFIKI